MAASTAAPKGKERFMSNSCEKHRPKHFSRLAFWHKLRLLSALSVRSDCWNGLNEI